ncbi:MAG: hypothetical protein GXX93_00900 [Anaerolineae bacterium]|nr:hypothetical protein [Anaerolineae bacterium]
MAKVVMSFDSYESIDGYEGKSAIGMARSIPGVSAVKVYRASASPRYSVELDADDEKVEDVQKAIESTIAPYRGYLSNWTLRVLREMKM